MSYTIGGSEVCNNNTKSKTGLIKIFNDDGCLTESYYLINGVKEGEFRSYHDNEVVKMQLTYVNGKRDGPCYVYNSKSELTCLEYYSKGKLHGECCEYRNGLLYISQYFKNGKLDGISKSYDVNEGESKLLLEIHYENNTRNGSLKKYYSNGQISVECNYVNDKLDGPLIIYTLDGDEKYRFIYENGNVV